MKLPPVRVYAAFALDAALLGICLLHIPSLVSRASLPCGLTESDGRLFVQSIRDTSACGSLVSGDILSEWNGQPIRDEHEAEFLADFLAIDDTVRLTYFRNEVAQTADVRLIPSYSVLYILIILSVGFVAWGVGVLIVASRSREKAALVLHWAMVLMGATVILTFGRTSTESIWMYVARPAFFLAYGGVGVSFLHFTLLFPRRSSPSPVRLVIMYVPMLLLVLGMMYFHLQSLQFHSISHSRLFQSLFDIFHVALLVYVCSGLVHFIWSYVRSESLEEKKKLQWVLWGLTVGPLPFLLFTIVPQYYLPFGFVPEEFTLIFLIVIPVAFGISFIKYHILDIEVVINRTTVYAIVLGAVVLIYTLVMASVATYLGSYTIGTSAAAAVLVALLFEPARKRVQHIVDKRFFRVRYNFREALRRLSDEIRMCIDAKQLADVLIARTDEIIPVERIGIFLLRHSDKRLSLVSNRGFEFLERRTIRLKVEELRTALLLPVALDSRIEPGIVFEKADERVFIRWGIALVLPMKSATGEFIGFFVLGAKKSGERFRIEDVDLLMSASIEAGMEFERIALQSKLIVEQGEKRRLMELNQMKSDFVSNVSHELRTPLTSIRMYAELLGEESRPAERKRRMYLKTIVGETDRLNRLVSSILDSAKIERGVKQYRMQDCDLVAVVDRVVQTMRYHLDKHRFQLEYRKPRCVLPVHGDEDAVSEALINLIDNAVKFSTTTKHLRIGLTRKGNLIVCTLRDKGVGISSEAIPHLFERFYRDPTSSTNVPGVGLGLPLVKHIMDAHGGEVTVRSNPGKGSTFTLIFPRRSTTS